MPNEIIYSKNKFNPLESTIILDTSIIDLQRQEGKSGFRLVAKASVGQVFHEEITKLNPEYCFVYKATDLNTVQKAEFIRVATIQDLKTYSLTPTEAGDFFRSDTYVEFFDEIQDALANKSLLRIAVYQTVADLNNVYGYAAYEQIDEQIILPTFIEDEVDGMIETLLGLRYQEKELTEKIKIINEVTIPLLNIQKGLNKQQFELLNNLQITLSRLGIDVPTLESFNMVMDTLPSEMLAAKEATDEIGQKAADLQVQISQIENSLTNARNSSNLGNVGNDIDSALKVTNTIKYKAVNLPVIPFATPEVAKLSINAALMKKVGVMVKKMNTETISAVENMRTIIEIIDKQQDTTDLKIKEAESEKLGYKNEKENIKRKIQELETELVRRIPTIDVDNPQSFWAVKVNVS